MKVLPSTRSRRGFVALGAGPLLERRAEVLQAGAAADVDAAPAGVLEAVAADARCRGCRLSPACRCRRSPRVGAVAEGVAVDHALGGSRPCRCRRRCRAPALDGAILDAEAVQPGELDAIMVPARADVGDAQPAQHDAARRGARSVPPSSMFRPLPRAAGEMQIVQLDVEGIDEMKAVGAAGEARRFRRIRCGENNGFARLAAEVREIAARRDTRPARSRCACRVARPGPQRATQRHRAPGRRERISRELPPGRRKAGRAERQRRRGGAWSRGGKTRASRKTRRRNKARFAGVRRCCVRAI